MPERRRGLESMQSNRSGTTDPYRDDVIPSDLYDTSTSRFSDAELFRRSPDGSARTTFPWRTTLVALFLFSFGIAFLLTGILHFWDRDRDTSIAFIIVGSIAFLPGTYVAFNLIQVLRGAPGFHLSQWRITLLFFDIKLHIGMTIDGDRGCIISTLLLWTMPDATNDGKKEKELCLDTDQVTW